MVPKLVSFDKNGLAVLRFNATMNPIQALGNETTYTAPLPKRDHHINNDDEEIMIYGTALDPSTRNFRRIQNGTIEYNGEVLPSLEILLLPFEPSEECIKRLNFSWEVVYYLQDELHI